MNINLNPIGHSPSLGSSNRHVAGSVRRYRCQVCRRSFLSTRGRNQHVRLVHQSFHNDRLLGEETSRRRNARVYHRWSNEEVQHMVQLEVEAVQARVANINQFISVRNGRSADAVSSKRLKDRQYREMVERALENAPAPSTSVESVGPSWSKARGRLWSAEELRILAEAFPLTQDSDLAARLLGRSLLAIRARRRRITAIERTADQLLGTRLDGTTPASNVTTTVENPTYETVGESLIRYTRSILSEGISSFVAR